MKVSATVILVYIAPNAQSWGNGPVWYGVQTNRHYLPEEVDWTLVKGHSDGGEDDKLEEEAKEEGDEAHQQGHRDHSLASKLCPLSKSVSQGCPTLC